MKRLLIALAAAVAVSTASAIIKESQLFEDDSWSADFVVDSDDDSELAEYGGTQPTTIGVPYPCPSFGEKYLSLDTGDAMLWCTNTAAGTIYFDMALQFNPSASAPELAQGDSTKILLYQNAESNLVILAGASSLDRTPTSYVTTTKVAPGTWARVTVSSELGNDGYVFTVRLNGTVLATAGETNSFPSLTDDTTITKVGFSGSGALDNFVARTTDPYFDTTQVYAANIGGEGGEYYATYKAAIEDALAAGENAAINYNGTTGNGTAANPYKITCAADLQTLQELVADCPAARSACYAQTADIDMASAGAFVGIGTYADNPTAGVPFTGTYDGQGYKISNVTFTDRDYAGIFNQVNGGTVQNLTVENLTFVGTGNKYCASIIGNAGNGATLKNLVATGSFGSAGKPGSHNMAGIAIRLSGGGAGTLVQNCTNNAAIYGTYTKLAGICALTQVKVTGGGAVTFDGCANNGTLTMPSGSTAGRDGLAGIVGYASDATVLVNCSNTGAISSTYASARIGELVGYSYTGYTLTDQGGNSGDATKKLVCEQAGTINGFKYATVENDVATTVTTLAAGNTYLLEGDVAKSETPVYTFDSAGTIAFDAALGYTFAGAVEAASNLSDVLSVASSEDGAVTTYTATMGTVVATITKNGVTASYSSLQNALAAAESGDTVNLVAAASGDVAIPAGVLVAVAQAQAVGATFTGITSLAGPGTIRLENAFPPNALCPLLMNANWNGTLEIYNLNGGTYPLYLTTYGNANSTIRLNQILGASLNSSYQNFTGTLEIGALGWNVTGSFNEIVLPSTLTGTGAITVNTTPASGSTASTLRFTGDVSGFTGNISFGSESNARVAFGDNKAGGKNTIYVDREVSVTNAATATWTADNVIVAGGELVANGTVTGTLKGLSSAGYTGGRYVANVSTAAITADSSWNGTYVVGWNPGAANTAFDINNYGTAANATIQIDGVNGEFAAFPREGTTVANVTAKIVLNANWSIGDGWTGKTNTFAYLTGSGNISVANVSGYTYGRIFNIKELDGYTGTLGGVNGVFVVDKVNVATQPENGARVVKTNIGTYGSINDNVPLYVGGTDTGKTLTYDANGAEGAGLYLVAPSGFDGGDGATFNIPAETQTALATKLPSGKTLADVADAASGMTYAQAYALGLLNETTGDVEDLKATIEVVGGKVKVSLDGATAGAAYTVTLKVYEKASLSAEWPDTPKATYTLGSAEESTGFTPGSGSAPAGFYKVGVSVSNK